MNVIIFITKHHSIDKKNVLIELLHIRKITLLTIYFMLFGIGIEIFVKHLKLMKSIRVNINSKYCLCEKIQNGIKIEI